MSILWTNRSSLADDLDILLRKSLKAAMLFRGMNEEELAGEVTKRSGRTVSPHLISAWKAETKHRWHLDPSLIPVICEILGDDTIQRLLLSEKLRQSLELGESTPRVVALLRSALPEAMERKKAQGEKKLERSKR